MTVAPLRARQIQSQWPKQSRVASISLISFVLSLVVYAELVMNDADAARHHVCGAQIPNLSEQTGGKGDCARHHTRAKIDHGEIDCQKTCERDDLEVARVRPYGPEKLNQHRPVPQLTIYQYRYRAIEYRAIDLGHQSNYLAHGP